MKIILFQPQIPQNTGNIVRTCKVTRADLILVTPLGFETNDRALRRAGLDYWDGVSVNIIDDLFAYLQETQDPFYFFSSHATKIYSDVFYSENAQLIFGSETSGLPPIYHQTWPEKFLTIPMIHGERCLNLSNSVAIGLYESLRQQQFAIL